MGKEGGGVSPEAVAEALARAHKGVDNAPNLRGTDAEGGTSAEEAPTVVGPVAPNLGIDTNLHIPSSDDSAETFRSDTEAQPQAESGTEEEKDADPLAAFEQATAAAVAAYEENPAPTPADAGRRKGKSGGKGRAARKPSSSAVVVKPVPEAETLPGVTIGTAVRPVAPNLGIDTNLHIPSSDDSAETFRSDTEAQPQAESGTEEEKDADPLAAFEQATAAAVAAYEENPAPTPADAAPPEETVIPVVAPEQPPAKAGAETQARRGGNLLDRARGLVPSFLRRPSRPAPTIATADTDKQPAGEPQEPTPSDASALTEDATDIPAGGGSLLDQARRLPRPVVLPTEEEPAELAAADTDEQPAGEPQQPAPAQPEATTAEEIRRENLIKRIADKIEGTKVFGKSLSELAFRGVGLGGVRWGTRELAKGIISWSGAAGAVGGGIAGTAVTGAFVGAVAGTAVEYVRQVNANLNQRTETTPNPDLNNRKAAFLHKFGELRHGEVYTNVNRGKLARAAIFGAITGAGAGAIADIPVVKEFIEEQMDRFIPGLNGVQQAASEAIKTVEAAGGNIWTGAGEMAGNAGNAIGQIPGAEGIGTVADTTIKTAGDWAGNVGEEIGDASHVIGDKLGETGRWANIGGAGDAAKEAAQQADEAAKQVAQTAKEATQQADLDQFRNQLTAQQSQIDNLTTQLTQAKESLAAAKQTIVQPPTEYVPKADFDNLQKDLAAIKATLAASTESTIPSVEQATAAASSAAEQAAAKAAETAQAQLNEAFANLNLEDNYSLHQGDSVAGITEKLGKSLGLTDQQAWQLGKQMAQDNGVTSPYYGTVGNVLDRQLPIGKAMDMRGVEKLALEMLKKKTG